MAELKTPFGSEVYSDPRWSQLPYSLRALGLGSRKEVLEALFGWLHNAYSDTEVALDIRRVLLQDLTGGPFCTDLAAMRDEALAQGIDPKKINPVRPIDLVVDHSIQGDFYGTSKAYAANMERDFERNGERYSFFKWGQAELDNFTVYPPGLGICHQVNLECITKGIWWDAENGYYVPDSCVGCDSHTTMVNAMGILAWGVGGIEALEVALGQATMLQIPEVMGVKLTGEIPAGVNATDVTLFIVQALRAKGVTEKFVEFFGPGLKALTVADRATVANMAPEYGSTVGFFPVDQRTIDYYNFTGRDGEAVKAFAEATGTWYDADTAEDLVYSDLLEVNLSEMVPGLSGPDQPEKFIPLTKMPATAGDIMAGGTSSDDGAIAIASITSCTNTSNPYVMVEAGLVAQKAAALGMRPPAWVKTTLAPGSQVVTDYLEAANLMAPLGEIGFHLAGYGCMTCIGNGGDINDAARAMFDGGAHLTSVLSGNRNFEARIHTQITSNFLASPGLVVIYALAGNAKVDVLEGVIGQDRDGNDVRFADLWPSPEEVRAAMGHLESQMFAERYGENVLKGPDAWQKVTTPTGSAYPWLMNSTYLRRPTFMDGMPEQAPGVAAEIIGAKVLVAAKDGTTTDHISPAAPIKAANTAAFDYLREGQVAEGDMNTFGSRRGNWEVMVRGTFDNVKFNNLLLGNPDKVGAWTLYEGEVTTIFDASQRYRETGTPMVVFGGQQFGKGSSRDWAAKGQYLLGVDAVIVESFERIHRQNLVGMGILPLVMEEGVTVADLGLDGTEIVNILGMEELRQEMTVTVEVREADGSLRRSVKCTLGANTEDQVAKLQHGGVMNMTMRRFADAA